MARTTKQIYQAIIDEKESLSSLDGLTPNPETTQSFIDDLATQSSVAIWRLSAWVFAFMSHIQETLWDVKETALQSIQDNTPPHTRLWWERKVKAFQYGDATIVNSVGDVTYETINEDNQIIARVNVQTLISAPSTPFVNIRVVKFNDPDYVVLDPAEQAAFDSYIQDIAPLGIKTNVEHNDGGLIRWEGTLWYDPAILNADMTRVDDNEVDELDNAMNSYINDWAMVNSKLNENVMIDYLRNAPGILDVLITSHKWRETPSDSFQTVTDGTTGRKELEINSVAASWDNGDPANLTVKAENQLNTVTPS